MLKRSGLEVGSTKSKYKPLISRMKEGIMAAWNPKSDMGKGKEPKKTKTSGTELGKLKTNKN